jgi:hypothetical protein
MNDEPIFPGYLVRITRAIPTWSGYWASQMTEAVGKNGIVERVNRERNSCSVIVPGIIGSWYYPRVVLEIVDRNVSVVGGSMYPPGHGPNNTHLAQELPR